MRKNLKIYLAAFICSVGMETVNGYSFVNRGVIPFTHNKYEGHKVTMSDEEKSVDFYTTKDYNGDAIAIRTPYEEVSDGCYKSKVLLVDTEEISNDTIEFIKENVSNQNKLLNTKSISDLIENSQKDKISISDCTYVETESIPKFNNYEVNYITFDADYDDKKMISDTSKDAVINLTYLSSSLSLMAFPFLLGYALDKKEKSKTKVL